MSILDIPVVLQEIIYGYLDHSSKNKYKIVSKLFLAIHNINLDDTLKHELFYLMNKTKSINRNFENIGDKFPYPLNIQGLTLSKTLIKIEHLLRFTQLKVLKLKGTRLSHIEFDTIAKTLTMLTKLVINVQKSPFPVEKFTQISKLSINNATKSVIPFIAQLTQLLSLKLSTVEPCDRESSKPLATLVNLTRFHFINDVYHNLETYQFPYVKQIKIEGISIKDLEEIPIIQNLKKSHAYIRPENLHEILSLSDQQLIELNSFDIKGRNKYKQNLLPYTLKVYHFSHCDAKVEDLILRLLDLNFECDEYILHLLPFQIMLNENKPDVVRRLLKMYPYHLDYGRKNTLRILYKFDNPIEFLETLIPIYVNKIPYSLIEIYFQIYNFQRPFHPKLLPSLKTYSAQLLLLFEDTLKYDTRKLAFLQSCIK